MVSLLEDLKMEIIHGMYTFEQPNKVFIRKWKLEEGKYVKDYSHEFNIPEKFLEMLNYLSTKHIVFELDFSIGIDGDYKVISVVHPRDSFCKKTAKKILTDRMTWLKKAFNTPEIEKMKRWVYYG